MIKSQPQAKSSSSSDSGFTIIESLLGVIVVAILLAAISPVLVMSTATRVQSRRMEKATQATNTLIDGLRTGLIQAPGSYNAANKIELPAVNADQPRALGENLITLTTMPIPTNTTNLYLFKKDDSICHTSEADCNLQSPSEEFYIQARQIIVDDNGALPNPNKGYRLVMRLYRGDVDFTRPLLASSNAGNNTASVVSEGLGNRQAPLIERTVDIANIATSFQDLCQRLGIARDSAGNNQNCE
ncbi:hormogonium polysaccharide secretion pseudopilin HpsB [Nodularia sphaerocarpa]|uniref:hormogonium polysaccharide secretion pseudopilin HpsB n=1 Tax=Nodularia sphaerocarpa TaxID=137816 RepID=UPI001EFA5B4E|nr:hormogonium polysaccharide secretion pseudopilin HpsB [Nodularia sphaerocarpa]MDB9372702.1 hormogonium polysaccharide secretion pseudopilin HpsB [Nodularia sphaerocarpa CS-585]MDB9377858.1 hormogonium polysaccharide secretion pseudopilin HpsB [Nodularia sphaerocarpa CS-585A2]ULP73635.1 hypothetical protein BDGGKGIB_03293 [Nodularia sphaerocarpa UHCC 0038]